MKILNLKYIITLCMLLGISTTAAAIDLSGLMTVNPKVQSETPLLDEFGNPVLHPVTGEPILVPSFSGSYFSMGSDNPFNGASIEGGTAGGIQLGTHQRFILNPDVPNPPSGTGYGNTPVQESTAMKSFKFFGVNTYIGTNGVSYQSGNAKPVVSATVDASGNMSLEISAWEVMWNGSTFEQGPRLSAAEGFFLASGTYDFDTGEYVAAWPARIVGGPFNGVTGFWHLEGKILAEPVNAAAAAGPQTLNVKSKGNGFQVALLLTDTDNSLIDPNGVNEGVHISSIGAVELADDAITENVAGRIIEGNTLTVVFDDPATGTRQDIIAAISDAPDGSTVTICASGTVRDANNILRPFEGCDDVTINNKGNH